MGRGGRHGEKEELGMLTAIIMAITCVEVVRCEGSLRKHASINEWNCAEKCGSGVGGGDSTIASSKSQNERRLPVQRSGRHGLVSGKRRHGMVGGRMGEGGVGGGRRAQHF